MAFQLGEFGDGIPTLHSHISILTFRHFNSIGLAMAFRFLFSQLSKFLLTLTTLIFPTNTTVFSVSDLALILQFFKEDLNPERLLVCSRSPGSRLWNPFAGVSEYSLSSQVWKLSSKL